MLGRGPKEFGMTALRMNVCAAALIIACALGGCTSSTTTVRQNDGTYKTYHELTWFPSTVDYETFECTDDYMVATTLDGVTYAFPRGTGRLTGPKRIEFEGAAVDAVVDKRNLTVNDNVYKGFDKGDVVRIGSDGRVFVNDTERMPVEEAMSQ
jgi:hypothetical protein